MREQYIKIHNLSVAKELADFVKNELLLDTDVGPDEFWEGFDKVCLLYTSDAADE